MQRHKKRGNPAADAQAGAAPKWGRPEDRVDLAVYIFAGLCLIGLGVWLGAVVLNWIIGPALIVVIVVFVTPVAHKFADGRAARSRTGKGGFVPGQPGPPDRSPGAGGSP